MATHLSVKELSQYVYATGDLNTSSAVFEREKIGQDIHRTRQNQVDEHALKEVFVSGEISHHDETFHLSGRMDILYLSPKRVIEEIKSTLIDLSLIHKDTYLAHSLQLKIYGYLYMLQHDLKEMTLELVYVHHPSLKTKTFTFHETLDSLSFEVETALETYMAFFRLVSDHRKDKISRFQSIPFPFDAFKEGQDVFISKVVESFVSSNIQFIEAPTGIGKTAASLHGAFQSIKEADEPIIYVTAKVAGQEAALKAMNHYRDHMPLKSVRLHAKDRLCLRKEVDCDPDICKYAKGYYDRVKGALKDLYQNHDVIDAEVLKNYGSLHTVCPHELALDVSLYSDVVVADYNYAFDPRVQLMRFFDEEKKHPKLLVDEAHNLVDRAKSMYSASLSLETLISESRLLASMEPSPLEAYENVIQHFKSFMEEASINQEPVVLFKAPPLWADDALNMLVESLELLMRNHKHHPLRKVFKDAYFNLLDFLRIKTYYSDAFVVSLDLNQKTLNILCTDPKEVISHILKTQTKGATLFSATLSPSNYYLPLINEDASFLKLPSPFPPKNLGLFIDVSQSLKYKDRTLAIPRIKDTLIAIGELKHAKVICYFPSFAFMKQVLHSFNNEYDHFMIHQSGMDVEERTHLFKQFKETSDKAVLLTVLGGSFSEGVELDNNELTGVFIIGAALPSISKIKALEVMRFNQKYNDGFHFAYTYPGMTRVIQAVGRVIRQASDKGFAILMDDRYQTDIYKQLMPDHWSHAKWLDKDDFISDYINSYDI